MIRVIGIGEWAFSRDKRETIKTFALGSCVAMTVYCHAKSAAGMVHIALPSPEHSSRSDDLNPGYYATRAVPMMVDKMRFEFGCPKGELIIEIFGGAASARADDPFQIGPKNVRAVMVELSRLGLRCSSKKETGGRLGRTVEIDVATGITRVIHHEMIL